MFNYDYYYHYYYCYSMVGFSLVALITSASWRPAPSSSSPTHSSMSSSNSRCCSSACPTMRATGEPRLRPPKQATLSLMFVTKYKHSCSF